MKIKTLTMAAVIGAFLATSGSAFAWGNDYHHGYHSHHKVKVYKKVYVKPSNWHKHPKNAYTNDTYHTHPNGKNHHVHNYGKGGHKHGAYYYTVCPYAH